MGAAVVAMLLSGLYEWNSLKYINYLALIHFWSWVQADICSCDSCIWRWQKHTRRWASSSLSDQMGWNWNWVKRSSRTSTCQDWMLGGSEPSSLRYRYLGLGFIGRNREKLSWHGDDWLGSLNFQNGVLAGVYPASPSSWLIVVIAMMSSLYIQMDPSLGMIEAMKENLPYRSEPFYQFVSQIRFLGRITFVFFFYRAADKDGVVPFLSRECMSVQTRAVVSAILFATALWLFLIYLLRYTLKALLSYHGWIFESHGKMSTSTKVWLVSFC